MPTSTKFQGSIVIRAGFTIRLSESSGTSDLALTDGTEYDSVDAFLLAWQTQINADIAGQEYQITVATSGASKGKIQIANAGHAITVAFAHAGDATESARVRDWLGQGANISGAATTYTFTNAHKAGYYPALAAKTMAVTSIEYQRGQRFALDGGVWTQNNTAIGDPGFASVEVDLQISTATDWSELGEFFQFVDDVMEYMGEPFSVFHIGPTDDPADHFTGYFIDEVIEIMGSRTVRGFNGLLGASFDFVARVTP